MRNMSFALTTPQVIAGTKDVTRRLGWEFLRVGELLRPVKKCMGLRPGEKLEVLRAPIRVVSLRREPLLAMLADLDYGFVECAREGFPAPSLYQWPSEFVRMFCATHKGCKPETVITRIEFSYEDT